MKSKLLLAITFMLHALIVKSQDPSASFYIDNATYISPTIYEFDIMAKASGATTSFDLRTFQAGIYVNPTWVNGGTLTLSNVSFYSDLSAPSYNGVCQWNATDKLINCSVNYNVKPTPSTCISTVVTTTPKRVTRIRAVNNIAFGCGTPDLKFNYVLNNSPLRLRTSFSWRASGCTTNYELFYPGRTYSGVAKFNDETYSIADADSRSLVMTGANFGNCYPWLNLTVFIEGYSVGSRDNYGSINGYMDNGGAGGLYFVQSKSPDIAAVDEISISLMNASAPYAEVATAKGTLLANGTVSVTFPSATNGNYYIKVSHRNTLETWSAAPVAVNSNTFYNFSDAANKAYGSNMTMVSPGVWAIYSGDISDAYITGLGLGYQDGVVESSDYGDIESANAINLSGYNVEDLTGDGVVESADYGIMENNNAVNRGVVRP